MKSPMSPEILRAAEQGDAGAQFKLGWFYESHGIIKDDYVEGPEGFLQHNEGNWKDLVEAAKWYECAAQQGHQLAMWRLAQAYTRGDGVQRDGVKAVALYRQLAKQGYSDAGRVLGRIYEMGIGVEEDFVEAAKWYRWSAEQGNAEAQRSLGVLYKDGREVPSSRGTARRWLRAALHSPDVSDEIRHSVDLHLNALDDGALPEALNGLEQMIGLGNVKAEIRRLTDFVEIQRERSAAGLKSEGVSRISFSQGIRGQERQL